MIAYCACGCGTMIEPWNHKSNKPRKYAAHSHAHKRPAQEMARVFWSRVLKTESCWLWQGLKDIGGYGIVCEEGRNKRAHRKSWELCRGGIPPGKYVLHDCPGGDNRLCVNPDHLWLGSKGDNNKDRAQKGRSARGERNNHAKLTTAEVRRIRFLRETTGATMRQLGRQFGVQATNICQIVRRKTWRHVE